MSDEQEQQRREEHWKELAALLGIEPDAPARSAPGAPAKPTRSEPEARREEPAPQRTVPQPREPAPAFDEVQPMHAEPLADLGDASRETDQSPQDGPREHEEGRGRRGGRRRRGRGRSGDRKDESRHKPYQRRRDEAPADSVAPGHVPEPAFDEPADDAESEDAGVETVPSVPAVPPRSRRDEERFAVEEPEEATDADDMLGQPIPVADDDEIDEEDAPADWNVVTWSELIASLKRF